MREDPRQLAEWLQREVDDHRRLRKFAQFKTISARFAIIAVIAAIAIQIISTTR